MWKILLILALSIFILSSCWGKNQGIDIEKGDESFDSPELLKIGENTSLQEKWLWDD